MEDSCGVFEWHFYVGESLTDGSVQPFKLVLTADIVEQLEIGNPDFWGPILEIIDEDVQAQADEAAAD